MIQRFNFNKVFLCGALLETNRSNCKFLERIFINNISKTMRINPICIHPSNQNERGSLLGAAIYGNHPEHFTERIARISYAVNIRAYSLKEFEEETKRRIEEEKSKDEDYLKKRIYAVESDFGYVNNDKKVDLFYQSIHNIFLSTGDFNCGEDSLTYFIRRGDKISEENQSEGISKTFMLMKIVFFMLVGRVSASYNLQTTDCILYFYSDLFF